LVRFLFAIVVVLIVGLLLEGIFDSAVGAWAAFAALVTLVALRLVGLLGFWPADWPDIFDDGD